MTITEALEQVQFVVGPDPAKRPSQAAGALSCCKPLCCTQTWQLTASHWRS